MVQNDRNKFEIKKSKQNKNRNKKYIKKIKTKQKNQNNNKIAEFGHVETCSDGRTY